MTAANAQTSKDTSTKPSQETPKVKPTKPSSSKKLIYLILAAIVILLIAGSSYFVLFKSGREKVERGSVPSTKEPTDTTAPIPPQTKYCPEGKIYQNTKQGYKVCLIKGWIKREFDPSAKTVGFDPKNIPEASEYGGLIVVIISNKTLADEVARVEKDLESTTKTTVSVDGVAATQISGTTPADFINPNLPIVETFFTKFNRLYNASLASNTAANKKIYDDFLESWRFIEGTPNPPWSSSGNILVDQPWPGGTITNPVKITGQALAFEGVVVIRIKDAAGSVLANSTAQAASGIELSSFAKDVTYKTPTTSTGTLELFTQSAKDGSEQDKVVIPIKFP